MKDYLRRVADDDLDFRLETFGAVQIDGPKWVGKTTSAEMKAASVLKLQEEIDQSPGFLEFAKARPSSLLQGARPRLIDEWQLVPAVRDAVRSEVDREGMPGLFLLTGSNSVDLDKLKHSGIGRISRMRMYPMSLFESGESSGSVSLKSLFADPSQDLAVPESTLSIEELVFAICRGGWPYSLSLRTDRSKLQIAKDYIAGVCAVEMSTVDGVRRDALSARLLLRSYARHVSEPASFTTILADLENRHALKSDKTLASYLLALEKLFIVEDIAAWCPAIRSKTAMRSGVKRELVDPSLACAALGLGPEALLKDMRTLGFMFECLVARDLRVYASPIDGSLSYYRDRYGLESDFVIHLEDGRFALVECKLGSHQIDEGAANLLRIRDLIRTANASAHQAPLREPDLMIVITGGKYAYRREDGVHVIPIGVLGP